MEAEEKKERLVEAAMALLQDAGGELGITVLNKALFYFDLLHLRDVGTIVTGSAYMALVRGPVVAQYEKRLLRELHERGFAVQDDDENTFPAKPVRVVQELRAFPHLNARALASAATISDWAKKKLAKEVSDFSHKNVAWKVAFDAGQGKGAAPLPIDMNLALQQIADTDPWLDEPLTESERAAVAATEEGAFVAW